MLDPNFTIPTPRLIVSHFIPTDPAHIQFVMTLNHRLEMQHVNQKQPTAKPAAQAFEGQMDLEAAQAYVDKAAARMARTGYGRYMIRLKDDSGNRGEMVGTVSMTLERYAVAPTVPDVGFKILPEFGGKGYVTEAARGVMDYYRGEKGQTKFAGFCDPTNKRSIKMFRRLEFENRGVREVKGVREGIVKCIVWTLGVGEREEDLTALGLGRKSDNE